MNREQLYNPVERGFERDIRKRLEYWARLRERRNQSGDGRRDGDSNSNGGETLP